MQESGHYSIAGFYFQLLATAHDALKLFWSNDDASSVVFTIEKYGQDATVEPLYEKAGARSLIQYKYSSRGIDLTPTDIREILIAFKKSADAANWECASTEFTVSTNRKPSATAKKWIDNKNDIQKLKELLHSGVSKENRWKYPENLLPIFQKLVLSERDFDSARQSLLDIGKAYGMLDNEITAGVHNLTGLLIRRASSHTNRQIDRDQLLEALVGHKTPLNLTEPKSRELQRSQVERFRRMEFENATLVPRAIYAEIIRAAATHPFLVIQGEGGVGKSVAAYEAVRGCLSSQETPPAFALISKAADLTKTTIQETVAFWRNQVQHQDGVQFDKSLQRLMAASGDRPVIAIYFDGLDEKHGKQGQDRESAAMLRQLIDEAMSPIHITGATKLSVVVTCRTINDLRGLGGGGHPLSEIPHTIMLHDFGREELTALLRGRGLDDLSERVEQHLNLRDVSQPFSPSPSAPAIDDSRLEMIRHPMLWRCFCELDRTEQHQFLTGEQDPLKKIAKLYLDWFFEKVERRVGHTGLNEAHAAMCLAARPFLGANCVKVGDFNIHWVRVCRDLGCAATHRLPIFEEAITAGIFEWVDENRKAWKWKRPWACEYLAMNGQHYD